MSTHGYGSREYWDARYARDAEAPDDWLQRYPVFRPLLAPHLAPEHAILVLGCGSSSLSEELWDDGFRRVTSIDFSPAAIAAMRRRAAERPGLHFEEMDARALRFDDASFDAVIDKGTLDAIACHPDRERALAEACAEVARVLRPAGLFFSLSMLPARMRLHHLERAEYGWRAAVHPVPKTRLVDEDDPAAEANFNWAYLLVR